MSRETVAAESIVGAHWPTNRLSLRLSARRQNADVRIEPRPAPKNDQLTISFTGRVNLGEPSTREKIPRPSSVGAHWPTKSASFLRPINRRVAPATMLAALKPANTQPEAAHGRAVVASRMNGTFMR